jgi:hypothetical protein
MINTIVEGTIMGIGITIMVMDDRRIDLNHFRRCAGTS